MRFASIGGQSNYAQAGKAVANDAAKTFDAARKNSVDFGGLAQAAMKVKSEEKIAAMKAEASVTKTAIDAKAYGKIKDAKRSIAKDGVMRKAGGLVALGVSGLADKPEKRDHSRSLALEEKLRSSATELRSGIKPVDLNFKPTDTSTNTGGTGASNTSTTSSSGKLISSGHSLSAGKGTAGSGGKYDLSAMTDYAIQGGFSPENA